MYKRQLIIGLILLSSAFSFADVSTITHKSCDVVLSIGSYGRYIMQTTYRLDMDGYKEVLTNALSSKGYNVIDVLNYGELSAFGKQGVQKSINNESLAIELRVAAPSYENDGIEKHRCAGGIKLIDPNSKNIYSVSDSQGHDFSKFEIFPPSYEKELETSISRWTPLHRQCQSVFNGLVNDIPTCNLKD